MVQADTLTNDFSPILFFFLLLGIGIVVIFISVGFVFVTFTFVAVVAVISLGTIATSILVGLHKKSLTKAFRTFVILSCSLGGLIIGMAGFWIVNEIFHRWTIQVSVIAGAFCGLASGFGLGYFALFVLKRLVNFLKQHFNIDNHNFASGELV